MRPTVDLLLHHTGATVPLLTSSRAHAEVSDDRICDGDVLMIAFLCRSPTRLGRGMRSRAFLGCLRSRLSGNGEAYDRVTRRQARFVAHCVQDSLRRKE